MKILIADDEPLARDRLKSLCNELTGYEIVGQAKHGKEALDLIPTTKPDIILLDIRMPGMDGIEASQHISKMETPPAVIFTTAYDQYALTAFESHAVGYLLKPIKKEKLAECLAAATRLSLAQLHAVQQAASTASKQNYISARVKNNIQLIPINTIRYFKADHKYVTVGYYESNTATEVLIEDSLISLEKSLGNNFIRIHRNALISQNFITGLEKGQDGSHWLCLQDMQVKLEVSRRNLPQIRTIIKNRTI